MNPEPVRPPEPPRPWHADPDDLATYRAGAGSPALVASLETHLLGCAECRTALASGSHPTDPTASERRWEAISDVVDAPRGLPWLRTALSTPTMRLAWVGALLGLFAALMVVSFTGRVAPAVLALAPLAPMAAVALSYRTAADPAGELALATPAAGLRLVAVRALLVGLPAVPIGVGLALLLQLPLSLALAWLLPGLALAALVLLAGTTRLDPTVVAGILAAAWALPVSSPLVARRIAADLVTDVVASPAVQAAALAVALLALTLTLIRRDTVAYRRTA